MDAMLSGPPQSRKLIRRVSENLLAEWKATHGVDSTTSNNSGTRSSSSSSEDEIQLPKKPATAQLSVSDRSFLNSMMVGRNSPPSEEDVKTEKEGLEAKTEKAPAGDEDMNFGTRGPMNDQEVVSQALTFILAG